MKVLLYGIQGAGKSTIGKYLAEKLNIPYIATGDIFRQLRDEDTENGRLVKSLIDQGQMVGDQLTMQIVNSRLQKDDVKNGFVLDGAPRTLDQEKLFQEDPDVIVEVNLSEEEAIKRLLARGRHDDTLEAIKKRLEWHNEKTKPLINFYKDKGIKVIEIDNSGKIEDSLREIDEQFKN